MKRLPFLLNTALMITVLLITGMLSACAPPPPEAPVEPPPGERVENAELGIAINELDPFFRVVSNGDARIVLEPADGATAGRLEIFIGSDTMNLVASVEEHKAALLAREQGEFSGQRELMLEAFGTAFYSRGRYLADEGVLTEETVVFTLHPRGGRLDVVYRYPAEEDSTARLQDQLFAVAAELVPFEAEPEQPVESTGSDS